MNTYYPVLKHKIDNNFIKHNIEWTGGNIQIFVAVHDCMEKSHTKFSHNSLIQCSQQDP